MSGEARPAAFEAAHEPDAAQFEPAIDQLLLVRLRSPCPISEGKQGRLQEMRGLEERLASPKRSWAQLLSTFTPAPAVGRRDVGWGDGALAAAEFRAMHKKTTIQLLLKGRQATQGQLSSSPVQMAGREGRGYEG